MTETTGVTDRSTSRPRLVDVTGLQSELLDCYEDNFRALLRHAGVADTMEPLARAWALHFSDAYGAPDLVGDSADERVRRDTGYVLSWQDFGNGDERAQQLAHHVQMAGPILVMADAYDMPWLPYHGHSHMEHSFVVDGADPTSGEFHIADAYYNDTRWGRARPVTLALDSHMIASILTTSGNAQHATLIRKGPGRPAPPTTVLRTTGENIATAMAVDGDLDRLLQYHQQGRADPARAAELSLTCWLGVRIRTRYGQWLETTADRIGDVELSRYAREFTATVPPRWARASEFAYLAEQRVQRGRRAPDTALAELAGPLRNAEASAARRQLQLADRPLAKETPRR